MFTYHEKLVDMWGTYHTSVRPSSVVAIAYEDGWYIGKVKKLKTYGSGDKILVTFFRKTAGCNSYVPDQKDTHWAHTKFILLDMYSSNDENTLEELFKFFVLAIFSWSTTK